MSTLFFYSISSCKFIFLGFFLTSSTVTTSYITNKGCNEHPRFVTAFCHSIFYFTVQLLPLKLRTAAFGISTYAFFEVFGEA